MSSPVTTPPQFSPLPPLPPQRQRSFAGPFVLIVLGIVFLLGTMGVLSRARMWHLFANYWPLLLILWGVIKLIEHQRARREGFRPSSIGAGGVLLAVLIVVVGLIATQIERVNWAGVRDNFNFDDSDFPNFFGQTFDFNDHLEQSFPGDASLKVINNHGAVNVHSSDDDKITVVVRKRVAAENQGDADKYNSETKPTIAAVGSLITVDAKVEAAGDHPVETDLDIAIPKKAAVSIVSRRGDINVSGRSGNVEISAQRSDTSVDDISANVKINQEKGSVRVEQVAGDVQVGGRVNDVTVSDVKGSVQLEGEFQESVKLERIAKTVTFKSSRTDMEFSHIAGSLDLDSDDLHADQITGPLRLTTRSKNIRLDALSGDVRLKNDNGSVELIMRTLGNVQIDNRNGDVQVAVPEKAGFRLDARTRNGGEIQSSDFPELKVDNDEHESKASGNVGNGSSHIVINNEHEGIEIRKASLAPPVPPAAPGKPAKALPPPKDAPEATDN